MRVSFFNKFDSIDDPSFQAATVQFTGPLLLHADPNEPLHIATKRYVDSKLTSGLNANTITSGTVSGSRLPVFAGDVSNAVGSTVFTLSNTGVIAGNYTKVTVDVKGRITAGYQLTELDIPDLSWTKITSGKPATLAGYGITDAVRSTGDTLPGTLRITGNPSDPLHAATKQYVDTYSLGLNNSEPTGTIVRRTNHVAPSGYLRCNGASLLKSSYPTLYVILGDRFGSVDRLGNGTPWYSQYNINNEVNTLFTNWANEASLPEATANAKVVITKNRVFLLGGTVNNNENTALTSVYTAPIDANGNVGAWSVVSPLPRQLQYFSVVAIQNKLYVIGGSNGNTNPTMSLNIYQATITTEGDLTNWITYPISLPKELQQTAVFTTRDHLFIIGGHNTAEGVQSTVYSLPFNEQGDLGAVNSTVDLPVPLTNTQVVVIKNFVYLIGGETTSNTPVATIYRTTLDSEGMLGNWTAYGTFPVVITDHQVVTTTDRVYVIGGRSSSSYYNTVYSSVIQEDNTLGTWTTHLTLPTNLANHQVFLTNSKLYAVGGKTAIANHNASMFSIPFLGGYNDYSDYYDGTILSTEDDIYFRIPNYSKFENSTAYYFIKHT